MKKIAFLPLLFTVLLIAPALAIPQQEEDIEVRVQTLGESVIVDLSMLAPGTRQEAWAVLTDFEHMSGFISNLKQSKVLSISGNTLNIFQSGSAAYGPIDFPFQSTREIQLFPFSKILSHLISGNMRKMDGTTQLIDENGQTRILYHTDTIPGVWIPPIAGNAFIEHEVREQFHEMRNEIIKRQHLPSTETHRAQL